jgi:glycosyltransferase involved in cell wall biosynthesis
MLEKINSRVYRLVLEREVLGTAGSGMRTVAIIDHPLWGNVLRRGDFDSVFYDCIDDISLYARSASLERFSGYEQRLLNLSEGAFVTAQKLEDHLRSLNLGKPIVRIPNGVDVEWFRRRSVEEGCPEDLEQLPRPRVGYIGTIADWIDFPLIERTARALPEVSFVFIGPLDSNRRQRDLSNLPNVRWLGRKPYESVPLYVQGCDVCWIPFGAGRITENTNPIKLFEYLSLGKPVVATGLPEVLPFVAGDVVYAGTNEREIREALRAALAEHGAELPARRLRVARDHSWDELVQKIVDVTTSTQIRRA